MREGDATAESITELSKRLHMEATELHSVVPIVRRLRWMNGELTLISLERYEDGSILRYPIVAPASAATPFAMPAMMGSNVMDVPMKAEDDLGTRYYCVPGGAAGGDRTCRGEIRVTPAIPTAAKRLTISLRPPLAAIDEGATRGAELQVPIDLPLQRTLTSDR